MGTPADSNGDPIPGATPLEDDDTAEVLATVSIGSYVWEDANGDGIQDATENPIAGAEVVLLVDDGTGAFGPATDANGVVVASVTTAADGLYEFENLPAGDYRVQVTPPAGYVASPVQNAADNADTTPADEADSNIASEPVPGTFESGTFTLSVGGEPQESDGEAGDAQDGVAGSAEDLSGNNTVDFGFVVPTSIGSLIFEDANGNGLQDAGEAPIEGVLVELLADDGTGNFVPATDIDGVPVAPITTIADGLYEFENLAPGDFVVRATPAPEFAPTPVQNPADDGVENDSNIAAELVAGSFDSAVINLASGQEPQETDAQAGDNQDGAPGSLDDLSGDQTVDFGFIVPNSIGSFVFEDTDLDGIQDPGEDGVANALVELLVLDDTGALVPATDLDGNPVAPITTAADGLYNFDNLAPGSYQVQVTPPAFFEPSPVQNAADDEETEGDVNIASESTPGTFQSGLFTLTSGGEPVESDLEAGDAADGASGSLEDLSGNNTVDFGFVAPQSIGSFVWEDLNADGQQDTNEPPIQGAQVALFVETSPGVFAPATDINGNPVPGVTTGPDGTYVFENLPEGTYQVQVSPPAGFFPSPVQTVLDDDETETDSNIAAETAPGSSLFDSGLIVLTSFDEPAEADSALTRGDDQDGAVGSAVDTLGNMTTDFGFVRSAAIGNFVWLDVDMDGVQDANEDGIAGVVVILTPPATVDAGAGIGQPITTITGPNGEYLFPDLPPFVSANPAEGYVVTVDTATLPAGLEQTFDEGVIPGSLGTLDNSSEPIQLDPQEEHLTADFGYAAPVGSLGDRIFVDANDNGLQDPGEPGIEGVTVTLTLPDGTTETQITDSNGNYLFDGLPLNEAYLVEVDITTLPPGFFSSPSNLGDPDVRDGFSLVADNQTTVVLTTDDPVNLDADFGYLPDAGQNNTIGDTIFLDVDEDGVGPAGAGAGTDVNELPLAGVTVTLIDTSDGSVVGSDITDANGQYLFTGVPDGIYEVLVTDQNNILGGLVQTFDQDDGVNPNPATPRSSIVDVDSLGVIDVPVNDTDQDFGFVNPNASSSDGAIGDTVFFDFNDSGLPDPGEGIEGVVVNLFNSGPDGIIGNADDVLIASDTTDENGLYLFTGLDTEDVNAGPSTNSGGPDALYFVEVDTSTLPNGGAGFINTVDPDTAGEGDSQSIALISPGATTNLDQDFGYLGALNVITGTLFADTDGNGIQDEPGIFAGVTVELRDQSGNLLGTAITDVDGNYEFPNLPDGIYSVSVTDEDNVLNGFLHTDTPFGATDTSDETSKDDTGYVVDLDSAGLNPAPVIDVTSDFGYEPVITNPISLGTFSATQQGSNVKFNWATQTEVANIGFNIYARVDDSWVILNDALIPSQGESVLIQDYEFSAATSATIFALSDIDFNGDETLHGPFSLGEQHGVIGERQDIDWSGERAEREAKAAERERVRQAEQKARTERKMQEMRETRPVTSRAPSQDEEISMLETTMNRSLVTKVEPKKSSYLNDFVGKVAAGVLAVMIPSAHAQETVDWINFATTEAGVHEVTYEQLQSDGVDLEGLATDQLSVINQEEEIPVQVTGGDTFGPGSSIRFIATSIDTLYTDRNIYTLRSGGSPVQIGEEDTPISDRVPTAGSYLETATFAPQVSYSFTSPDETDPWYALRMLSLGEPVSETIELQLTDVAVGGNSGSTAAKMNVSLWGATDLPGSNDHRVQIDFNGSNVADERFDGMEESAVEMDLQQVVEGVNEVTLTLPTQEGVSFDGVNINEVSVSYPRQFVAQNNRISFTSGFSRFNVRGFEQTESGDDPDILVLRERDGEIVEVTNKQVNCRRGCTVTFGGSGQVANYYVTANRYEAETQPLVVPADITSANAQYLIISHPDFIGQAGDNLLEEFAEALESQMGSVDIVDVDQIYAQFGGHVFDPTSIQRYIQFAHANRATRYVLLVGGDVYDYRQFENQDATSFIPSLYAATSDSISFAPVDAKYADIDNDNVPDLPIARLPVRTTQQLQNLMNKYRDFNNRSYRGTAVVVADEFDTVQQYDFASDADEIISNYLGNYETTSAYVDEIGSRNARDSVTSQINQGVTLASFFGHSSTNQWGFNGLFTGNDAARLDNVGRPTVVMQWGCWNTYYVSPNEDSMGQRFLMEGEQGAVAVMGASTLTDANAERELARLVFARLSQGERLGDAVTNAKQEYAEQSPENLDVILGWTILGMPELLLD